MKLKIFTALKPALFLVLTALMTPVSLHANDLFKLAWRGRVYFTNSSGKVMSKPFTEKDVVRVIARNNGLNPKDLVLVYRPNAYDTAVVFKANGQVVADYQQIPDVSEPTQRTDVTSASGTTTIRQAFLFDERHGIDPGLQIGCIFGSEKQKRDPNNQEKVTSESFHGTFMFAIPEFDNPDWQQGVYKGTFVTGGRIIDRSVN